MTKSPQYFAGLPAKLPPGQPAGPTPCSTCNFSA